ncbi:glycosyltransferase family 1 protein [Nocardioides sp. CCNWLW212]
MMRPEAGAVQRWQQLRRLLGTEGVAGLRRRVRVRLAEALVPPGSAGLTVTAEEIDRATAVAAGDAPAPEPLPWRPGEPLRVAWVCTPPAPGSGGHTTMFRLVAALERAGHRCDLYLRDRHGWSVDQHRATVRAHWPEVRAEVHDLADGIADAHAVVATGWETAYAVLASRARGRRCYLVQDLEPMFYPAGSAALLAEATYGFKMQGITAGPWLAERLRADHQMAAEHFDLGCDLGTYRARADEPPGEREGVAYYCRPGTPRRAHELALLALERFARLHPQVPIHCYGAVVADLPFPAHQHGRLSPTELGALYRRCVAGLVLSATNVSLVPLEMLAAGCVPVVNDADQHRAVLANPHVRYARPTPRDLAAALGELVDQAAPAARLRAARAAASVDDVGWERAGVQVERLLLDLLTDRVEEGSYVSR